VRVTGLLFVTNPGLGTVIDAPLPDDISEIRAV
jgi:hypothetical protein